MNVQRIAIFIGLLQLSVYLVSLANIPIKCSDDGTTCIYFSVTTINSNSIQNIIKTTIDSGQYKSTQVESDITTDAFTSAATALGLAANSFTFAAIGIYNIIIFFLGYTPLTIEIALGMQAVVYFFYAFALISIIRGTGGGDI